MESLFKQETAQKFIERINKLTPQSKAQWGTMNVGQMLHHCQKPLEIAMGQMVPKVNPIIKFLFGKGAKKTITGTEPFKKSLPTFSEAIIKDQRDFEAEKKKLIDLITTFQQKGANGLTKDDHPFFGAMTVTDWDYSQVKHLEHHLQQFGV